MAVSAAGGLAGIDPETAVARRCGVVFHHIFRSDAGSISDRTSRALAHEGSRPDGDGSRTGGIAGPGERQPDRSDRTGGAGGLHANLAMAAGIAISSVFLSGRKSCHLAGASGIEAAV